MLKWVITMYEIYTRSQCLRCEQVKALLIEKKAYYKEYHIGTDVSFEDVKSLFPKRNILPIILKNGLIITTIDELRESLDTENVIRFDSKL